VDDRIATTVSKWQKQTQRTNLLRKNLDDASAKPLIANSTHPILRHQHMSIAAPIATGQPIAQPQSCFLVEGQDIAQAGYDATFVDFGIRGADVAAEIGLEVFDG